MDIKKQERRISLIFILSIFFYTAFILLADIKKILSVSAQFNWKIIPLLLLITFFNYVFRFFRWHYLLKKINITLSAKKSFQIFFSGISMTVTPGKMGEVLKAYLVKKETGNRFSEMVPLLVFERMTDGIAMIILALGGVYFFRQSIIFFIFSTLLVMAFIVFIYTKNFIVDLIKQFEARFFHIKILDFAVIFFENSQKLLSGRNLIIAVFLGIIAWSLEGISLFLLVNQFVVETYHSMSLQGLFYCLFIFSFSSIAGFLVLIPGGVGVAEGSITSFLMLFFKMTLPQSIFLTLIFRFVTLWFGVSLGLLFLLKVLNSPKRKSIRS
jgi:uncharacterized protein (TIRG00374 family)